jgi:hypothetical protein
MSQSATATVVAGELRLDEPLDYPDHTRVEVRTRPLSSVREQRLHSLERLKDLMRRRPIHSGGMHFTRDELHERG